MEDNKKKSAAKKPASKTAKPKTTKAAPKKAPAKATPTKSVDPAVAAAAAELSQTPASTPPVTASTADAVKKPASGSSRKKSILTVVGIVVAVVLAFLAIIGVLIYQYKSDNRIVKLVSAVVPYPVESVNGHWVSYNDYLFQLGYTKHYYSTATTPDGKPQIDFNTADGKQKLLQIENQIMDQLKSDAVVRQLAAKNKVKVTNADINKQLDEITKSAGGEKKLKEVLSKYYGWNVGDLKNQIKFQLLKQKLSDKLTSDPAYDAQAKAKANDVLKQVQAGGNFADLAKKYSQDTSAANGGDLGCLDKNNLVKPYADAASALQVGQVSGLVKSQYGYHIIKVTDKKDGQICSAHILIKPLDFDEYLQQQTADAKTTVFLKLAQPQGATTPAAAQ